MRPWATLPALLVICALAGCSTVPPATTPASASSKPGSPFGTNGATARPAPLPMPSLVVHAALSHVIPSTNQVCYTNKLTGIVACFTPKPPPPPYTGLMILFPCTTNATNHSVVQSSPDLKVWQDVPASAFGYSNYNAAMGTYLYGSAGQTIGLILPGWPPSNVPYYREQQRP
jgi:hypothetical protein